jgi:hypothetical protein
VSRRATRRRAFGGALCLAAEIALTASSRRAAAQAPEPPKTPAALPQRAAQIALEKGIVKVSVGFRDVVDAEISKKLLSGLPTVITMRGYVFRESGGDPVALTAKSCRVVFDLWDEVFRIQITQPGGSATAVAVNTEGVLRNCAEARKMPLMERSLMKDGTRYFVAALVEVNPVSAEMLDRIKRWVTRPNGSAAIGPGDSLFGSFVGLFVARVESADRRLAWRTQAFLPPSP